MLKRKRILSLKMKSLPPLCCQRSHKIWCHPLDSVRLSLTLLLFLNKLLKCFSSTNILQYFLVFFLSVYYLYFEIFINAIITSANCNAFSIIKQYIVSRKNHVYFNIQNYICKWKGNYCTRIIPIFFHKSLQISKFSILLFFLIFFNGIFTG